jgi:hypothetical protein
LRKIIYSEPQFHKWINKSTGRIIWGNIRAYPGTELMTYLAQIEVQERGSNWVQVRFDR